MNKPFDMETFLAGALTEHMPHENVTSTRPRLSRQPFLYAGTEVIHEYGKDASRLVSEPLHELKLEIDPLLPAEHKPDHSAPRKILEVSRLAECQQMRALYP